MSRIDAIFASLRAGDRRAVMPFICGGSPANTGEALGALEQGGASIAEVGIPFSDPIADGPVIAAAMHRALERAITPARVFEEVAAARARLSIGVIAMCSVSIAHRLSAGAAVPFASFCRRLADAGFDGLIVPDIVLEESDAIRAAAAAHGLSCTLLVAPNTSPARAASIAHASTGFIYLMAQTGITGERDAAPDIAPAVARIRSESSLPIACGFGISTAAHVRAVVRQGGADAAIVGSAMVRRMEAAAERDEDPCAEAERFTRELTAGLA
ncbi:MAG: tryptophan synthase subunit alpha [Phycisphaerales bacterium]